MRSTYPKITSNRARAHRRMCPKWLLRSLRQHVLWVCLCFYLYHSPCLLAYVHNWWPCYRMKVCEVTAAASELILWRTQLSTALADCLAHRANLGWTVKSAEAEAVGIFIGITSLDSSLDSEQKHYYRVLIYTAHHFTFPFIFHFFASRQPSTQSA